jgi:hypothetical protein
VTSISNSNFVVIDMSKWKMGLDFHYPNWTDVEGGSRSDTQPLLIESSTIAFETPMAHVISQQDIFKGESDIVGDGISFFCARRRSCHPTANQTRSSG